MSRCRLRTRSGRSDSSRPHAAPRRRSNAIETLGVVTEGPDQLVSDLSGGNQQKVVMGRALASRPSVLVLMDPTAGVDVKSKEALLARRRKHAPRGTGRSWWRAANSRICGSATGCWSCGTARSSPSMRRVGATTSSSRRSRGFELTESSAPAPAAQRSLVAQRTSSIALARLRDLALLPALAVLHRHRLHHKPRFPHLGEHQHDPDLVGGSGARRARGIARHHHRQVRPVARVDLRHRARDRRHGGRCLPRISASDSNGRLRSAFSWCWSSAVWSASSTASWW